MHIVFQPKIIIGSIFGFIISAIGIIAIFFPSFFNLETKKIEEYDIEIETWTDIHKLEKELIDFSHKKNIFKLYVTCFCIDEKHQGLPDKIKEHFYYDSKTDENKIIVTIKKEKQNTIINNKIFYFENIKFNSLGRAPDVYTIKGYFIFENSSSHSNTTEYYFKHIDEELIKLKEYR